MMNVKNIQFLNAPPMTAAERYSLAYLAVGKKCPPPSFFESFVDDGTNSLT